LSGITIIGSGHFVPGAPIPNERLARVMETSDEWIQKRTGIKQRHFAEDGVGVSDLGAEAARRALADAGVEPSEVDFIIFATMTPEHLFPGPGGVLGEKLGIIGVPALDIRQQCASVPFGLQVVEGLVRSGAARTVLLVCADIHAGMMPFRDWDVVRGLSEREVDPVDFERATKHRGVAVVFGDGASAFVLRDSGAPERGLIGTELHTDGSKYDHIYVPIGFNRLPYVSAERIAEDEHIPAMKGGNLLKTAAKQLSEVVRSLCQKHGVTLDDVDCFVAHQANDRINAAVRAALALPAEKVPSNIARFGNTSAATIGILTDELRREGRVREGDLICFLALGAGLHWGAALMRL
jgi:3-oxoacyl-[acyl-carrier-protein] synthase III